MKSCDTMWTKASHILVREHNTRKSHNLLEYSVRNTQKPAGKMKFIVLLIRVMPLKGMQLHRHISRHGHERKMTEPLRETDKLGETDNTADKQKCGKMTMIQKDFNENRLRSNLGSVESVTDYGTNTVQNKVCNEKVMPKPGIRKNKLVAKYRTNFRYMGIVKNGLDRVMVMISIPIPRFENIKVKPINFARCVKTLDNNDKDERYLITADTQASKAVKEWCAQAIPYIEYLQQQEKYYIDKVNGCVMIYTQLCPN